MKKREYRIVVVSGYFNPLHTGHLDYLEAARNLGDSLCVIVNNDNQVKLKGSIDFMSEDDRLRIVRSLKVVDVAVMSKDQDGSVVKTIAAIQDIIDVTEVKYNDLGFKCDIFFANGGDRNEGNTPEGEFCYENAIQTVYNVGAKKTKSSSELLNNVKAT